MILWLTGNSGSGKTTLARCLTNGIRNSIILDGDEMRESISVGAGFSKADRHNHNLRVARLARVLEYQGFFIIVSVIAPFRDTRAEIDTIVSVKWVHVKRHLPCDVDRPYEIPLHPFLVVDSDNASSNENADFIIREILKL